MAENETEQKFRPAENIARFLMSTPSRLVGELECPGLLLTHAFPGVLQSTQWQTQISEGPYSRSHYVISTSLDESKNQSELFTRPLKFEPDMITDLASLWFGKRFDLHGPIEKMGLFWMPYGTESMPTRMYFLGAYNHKPRKDLQVPLKLDQLSVPVKLFSTKKPRSILGAFWKAASFYARSLRAYEDEPEVAFLDLISALEIIASELDFSDDVLYDPQTLKDLKTIEANVPGGAKVAQRIKSRLFQIRRQVVESAVELTNDTFFKGSESREANFALTKERLRSAVRAAYDVRSLYVHTGARFSIWVDPHGAMLNEMVLGKPVLQSAEKELADPLSKMPTFLGLERLVRFMILRFAHSKIVPLHDGLN
jgi:hypothetical protein